MKKFKLIPLLALLFFVACSDNIDSLAPDSVASKTQLTYKDFISNYLVDPNDQRSQFIKADDMDKLRQSMEIVNLNNGTNYSETNLLPYQYLSSMIELVQDELALLPDIQALDEQSIQTVYMDFPTLSPAQITEYQEHLSKYYERKLEYAAFQKLSIDDNGPLGNLPRGSRSGTTGLCTEELLFLALHPLKAPVITLATFTTGVKMASWFADGYLTEYLTDGDIPDNIQANAVQHALWNYLIAKYVSGIPWPVGSKNIGLHIAEQFTYAHEQCPENGIMTHANAMDLHNNKIGRDIFTKWDNLSDTQLRQVLLEEMADAWPACNTIPSVQASPVKNMVYTHYINSNGANVPNNCVPMQISVTANRPYNGPDQYSWVSNVSGHTGSLTYKWYWDNVQIGAGPNLISNITDDMFDSQGRATIKLDVRSSTHQRKTVYVTVIKSSGIKQIGGDGPGPII